jgi:hypothetical protein
VTCLPCSPPAPRLQALPPPSAPCWQELAGGAGALRAAQRDGALLRHVQPRPQRALLAGRVCQDAQPAPGELSGPARLDRAGEPAAPDASASSLQPPCQLTFLSTACECHVVSMQPPTAYAPSCCVGIVLFASQSGHTFQPLHNLISASQISILSLSLDTATPSPFRTSCFLVPHYAPHFVPYPTAPLT